MAKRKSNKTLIFTGIAIGVVSIIIFYFGVFQQYLPYADNSLTQKGMTRPVCTLNYDGYTYGGDSSIILDGHKYDFKTISQVTYLLGDNGAPSAYSYIPSSNELFSYRSNGYGFNIEIYRDDVKIDEIPLPASSLYTVTRPVLPIYRAYGIDGTVYKDNNTWQPNTTSENTLGKLPTGINGINVIFGSEVGTDGCSRTNGDRRMYFTHKYHIVYPLSLNIALTGVTSTGADFKLVSNKNATIKMSYTILGATNEVREETIALVQGENVKHISYADQKEAIRFTFKEIIPGTNIVNLNYISNKILNEVPKAEQSSAVYEVSKYSSISLGEEVTDLIYINIPVTNHTVNNTTNVTSNVTTNITIVNNTSCWTAKGILEQAVISDNKICYNSTFASNTTCPAKYYNSLTECEIAVLSLPGTGLWATYGLYIAIGGVVFIVFIIIIVIILKKPKK